MTHASRRSTLIIALSSCLGATTTLPASTASACSGNPCFPEGVAPAEGQSVPGNLPGFPVTTGPTLGFDAGAGPEPQLIGPGGQPVPTDLKPVAGAVLLAPRQPLAPGNYRLRWMSSCRYVSATEPGVAGPPMQQERAVTVTTAAPLPTSIGTVNVQVQRESAYTVTADASCTTTVSAAVARFALSAPAELQPFLSVARLSMTVDGQSWAASPYGGGTRIPTSIYWVERRPLAVHALCQIPGPFTLDRGLPEGHHHAELTVEIPGLATTLAPVSVDFDLSCASPDGGTLADGGASPDGPAPARDAPASADAPVVAPPSPSSGCAYSPGAGGMTALPMAALALLIVRLARRRRSPLPSDRRPRPWWPTR
jgi:hypothetical protein